MYSEKFSSMVHKYALVAYNYTLLTVYVIFFILYLTNARYLNIPWSARETDWRGQFWGGVDYSDPNVGSIILDKSGCGSDSRVEYGKEGIVWEPEESSGLCQCLYINMVYNFEPFLNESAFNSTMLQCALGWKQPTVTYLYDEGSSFWVTNLPALVGFWNILTCVSEVHYLRVDRLGTELENPVLGVIMLVVALASIPFLFVLPGLVIGFYVSLLLFSVLAQFVIHYTVRALDDRSKIDWKMRIVLYQFTFWANYVVILPLAVVFANIAGQRRDYLFNLTGILVSLAVGFSTFGSGFFNNAQNYLQVLNHGEEYSETVALRSSLRSQGSNYSNVANYVVLANLVTGAVVAMVSYPAFSLNFVSNAHAVSGVVLGLLFVIALLENSIAVRSTHHSTTFVHRVRTLLEASARTIATVACVLDLVSIGRGDYGVLGEQVLSA